MSWWSERKPLDVREREEMHPETLRSSNKERQNIEAYRGETTGRHQHLRGGTRECCLRSVRTEHDSEIILPSAQRTHLAGCLEAHRDGREGQGEAQVFIGLLS